MKDSVKVSYIVTVEIDPEAWSMNYGTGIEETVEDIQEMLPETIRDRINSWIHQSGNSGYAKVVAK